MSASPNEQRVRRVLVSAGTELVVRATRGSLSVTIDGDAEVELRAEPSRQREGAPGERPRDLRVERALAALRAEPRRRFSTGELAKLAGASASNFVRLFTRAMGVTPSAWLAAHRLELARKLLAETNQGLAEIANQTGYASEFGLSRAFKRRFGVAPSVFRRTAGASASRHAA